MATIVEVKVPDIGDFKDVPVIEVLVKPGDTVTKEMSLVTLESDKATLDVPSPLDGVVKVSRFLSDPPVRPSEILAPRGTEHRARRFGLCEPLFDGAVTAHFARGEIAQADTKSSGGVPRHRAAEADLDIVRVWTEDEQIKLIRQPQLLFSSLNPNTVSAASS